MGNYSSSGRIEATIPARADTVHILRAVAASVAARSNLTVDKIDDLRIAVDEASTQLLSSADGASFLTMSTGSDGGWIDVQICTDGQIATWPPAGLERTLAWQVLQGLSDQVSLQRTERGPAVVIRMRAVGAVERR